MLKMLKITGLLKVMMLKTIKNDFKVKSFVINADTR